MTEVITKVVAEGLPPYIFEDVPCGTAFTVGNWTTIFIKIDPLQKKITEGLTDDVNAVNVKTGTGIWFSADTMVSPYKELICRR